MKYVITSDRVVGHKAGDIVPSVKGANMDALCKGGHAKPAPAAKKKAATKVTANG